MNKITKSILLFVALLLPALVFVFLKMFGENKFDIPIYNHTYLEEGVSCPQINLPHTVDRIGDVLSNRSVNIYHLMTDEDQEQLKNLMIVKDRLANVDAQVTSFIVSDSTVSITEITGRYQISGIWKVTATTGEDLLKYQTCQLLTVNKETLVLVDKRGIIRGYYFANDGEDIDRLILESKILLHIDG